MTTIGPPMSTRWLPAMQAEVLRSVTYADIWSGIGGVKIAGGISVIAGSVTADRNNAIRRTATSVTFVPDAAGVLLPLTNGLGALYPTGAELALYKGCIYPDGTEEFAALGRFLLEESDVNDDASGVTIIGTLKDRAQTVTRAAFSAPVSTDGVSPTDVMIQYLINQQVSGIVFSFSQSSFIPPVSVYNIGDDAWTAGLALAAAAGMELFFDVKGICVLQPIIDPNTIQASATYLEGTSSAPVAFKRSVTNATVPNICCVQSSGSGVTPPIQTFWWDSNPNSRTFFALGTPGPTLPTRDPTSQYPTYLVTISTTVATTLAQCQAIANAAGLGYIGTIEGNLIQIRDNPAHDINDVVVLQRVVAGITTPTNYVVDSVLIDLTTQNPLQLTTRLVVPGS
jgi:hypothetical protein